jgi:Zn-dependent M28 family amino/carboxypeptidase
MRSKTLFLLLTIALGCSTPPANPTMEDLLATVEGDSIKAHIAYLADDRLRGRLPGTPEYDIAVDYVIDQYKQLGLAPGGDNGSYLQEVTIRKAVIDEAYSSMTTKKENELTQGEDYFFLGDLNHLESELTAETVFVGYGIQAPQLNHDDYANKNVEGKIVVIISGAPKSFPSTELAHFANYGTKFETAVRNGASGIILTTPGSGAGFERTVNRYRTRGNTGIVSPGGESYGRRVFAPSLKFVALMNWSSIGKLFGTDGDAIWAKYQKDESVDSKSIALSIRTASIHTDFTSPNVIGLIQGTDLGDEYVVHSAHLDHVGVGTPIENDSIYNGAHDNASGVASLLEIARLYQKMGTKPRRSVLFVMVTAEEMGLLGSDYFTRYPTVDINAIVANVNTDMPTLIAPLLSIEPLGAEHSSLMENVQAAADILDLEIMPDHMPEQVRFVRSDQYNFIRQGIPALHVKYGLKSSDSLTDLSGVINDYTKNIYHKPSDELNNLFDFEAGAVYVRLNFLISYSVANQDSRPTWNEGDFFGEQE